MSENHPRNAKEMNFKHTHTHTHTHTNVQKKKEKHFFKLKKNLKNILKNPNEIRSTFKE